MCLPAVIIPALLYATVAISAASAAASIVSQNTQRQQQKGYQNQLAEANRDQMANNRNIATRSYLDQAAQSNQNLAQEREAAALTNYKTGIQATQAKGHVLSSAAESGTGGLALSSLMDDFNRQESMFRSSNDQNLLFKQQQTGNSIEGARQTAVARIAQVQPYIPSPIAPVDYIGPSLKAADSIAGAGLAASKPIT